MINKLVVIDASTHMGVAIFNAGTKALISQFAFEVQDADFRKQFKDRKFNDDQYRKTIALWERLAVLTEMIFVDKSAIYHVIIERSIFGYRFSIALIEKILALFYVQVHQMMKRDDWNEKQIRIETIMPQHWRKWLKTQQPELITKWTESAGKTKKDGSRSGKAKTYWKNLSKDFVEQKYQLQIANDNITDAILIGDLWLNK